MNDKDAEQLVINDLEKNGQNDFKIIGNTWTVGTNVRTIIAKKDNITITFTINDNTEEIIDRQQSRLFEVSIIASPITVNDWVQRTVKGIRTKKNKFALLALIVISSFEIFVVLSNNDVSILTTHLLISILIFISGYFAFGRIVDLLRVTFRPLTISQPQQNTSQIIRRCNSCKTEYQTHPCPKCGSNDSLIIEAVNESESIIENKVSVKKKYFTKINYFGLGFFIFSISLQIYFSYFIGGIVNLTNSSLMALILFIPSYYIFLKIIFTDTESLHS